MESCGRLRSESLVVRIMERARDDLAQMVKQDMQGVVVLDDAIEGGMKQGGAW